MSSFKVILNSIKRITGKNRVRGKELNDLELFVDTFNQSEEVDKWLNENWETAKLDDKNRTEEFKKRRKKLVLNKDRFSERINIKVKSAAAIVLLTLGSGAWLFTKIELNKTKLTTGNKQVDEIQKEQLNSVLLERGNHSYNLSSQNINIADNDINVLGTKTDLKLISNTNKALSDNKEGNVQVWSTVKVPRSKDYYVVLSDGTQVWMNACSELSFPDYFEDGKREVKLKGEAYFIVKSDVNNPFYVETSVSTVKVTGTKFNVYCYQNEQKSLVTLVEGKVGVSVEGNFHQINPGQQLIHNISGNVDIKNVDPYQYISWKEGIFEFNDMKLMDMSLRLEKWYDIDFEFENDFVASQRFTGMVKKKHDIEYFIKVLEKTTSLKFTLQGSKIVVKEKAT